MSYGRIGLLAAMAMMSMGAALTLRRGPVMPHVPLPPPSQRFADDSDVPGYLRRPRSQAKQRLIRRRRGSR
jgi:hypothetical protein